MRVKDNAKTSCKGSGRVIAYNGPMLVVESYPMKGMIHEFAPNQLINLTRIEEENRKITDPLPLMSEETADELIERVQRMQMGNWKPEDHDIMPPQFKLDVKIIEEMAKEYAEQWCNAYNECDVAFARVFFDDFPSPYTRDVYTSTKDYD